MSPAEENRREENSMVASENCDIFSPSNTVEAKNPVMPDAQPKKAKVKRSPSNYMAIRKVEAGDATSGVETHGRYDVIEAGTTPNKVIDKLIAGQLEGEFVIVCVRRKVTLTKSVSIKVAG